MGRRSENPHAFRLRSVKLLEPYPVLPILIDLSITKEDCFKLISEAKIPLPEMYHLGFPNANCIGCVKASSATYWDLVRKCFPEVFRQRAIQSRSIGKKGCRLVYYKGKRIFLDELPANAKGNKLKSMPDCGIFCETK